MRYIHFHHSIFLSPIPTAASLHPSPPRRPPPALRLCATARSPPTAVPTLRSPSPSAHALVVVPHAHVVLSLTTPSRHRACQIRTLDELSEAVCAPSSSPSSMLVVSLCTMARRQGLLSSVLPLLVAAASGAGAASPTWLPRPCPASQR
jgi:hypothetical protein